MKKAFIAILFAAIGTQAMAQDERTSWINNVQLSGYGIVQYQYSGQDGAKTNTFNVREARFTLDGRIVRDFYWKAQIQFTGNTSTLITSPRMVDVFMEWQKYDFLRVKMGQFPLPFTFESSLNPIDEGFMSFAQGTMKLDGFNDRSGAQSSNGRDIGLQVQGDFLKNSSGRNLLHYQVGVFNGQGISLSDVDQRKNIVGGVWVMPVNGLRIGLFGLDGSYARKGTWTDETTGETRTGTRSLAQYRYAISGEYITNDWTFRSEYIHSHGYAFAQQMTNTDDESATNCALSPDGNRADALYAQVIAPIIKNKLHVKARYDMYRPSGAWNKARTEYEFGADYEFARNLQVSGEYAFINDRSLNKQNYGMIDVEVSYRF